MRAAIFYQPGAPLRVEEVAVPRPKAQEVLVRLRASGVCHSDLHVVLGEWVRPRPMILGHEGAGVVEAVGSEVRDVAPGDHVILSWKPSCRRCAYCLSGRPQICTTVPPDVSAQGWIGAGPPALSVDGTPLYSFAGVGAFAEYALVTESAAIPIRKDMPLETAALIGCSVMTGVGAVLNTAGVEAGAGVLVIGCGGVGLAAIQGAVLASAHPIIAADLHQGRLEAAERFGATHCVDAGASDVVAAARRITGDGVDYAFEAIGAPQTIEQAYRSLRPGGTAVVVGQAPDNSRIFIDPYDLSDHEKVIRGCNYGSARPGIDFPRLADLAMAGKLRLDALVTSVIGLEHVNRAFEMMQRGEGLRTVIRF